MEKTQDDYRAEASGIRVGELIAHLQHYPASHLVSFGPEGHFTFKEMSPLGDNPVRIIFNETEHDEYVLTKEHPLNCPHKW